MRRTRTILALLLAAALVAFAAPRAEAAKYVLKLAHNNPPRPRTLYQSMSLTLKNFVNIYSNGEADIRIFPAGQLGGDKVAAKKVQLGSVDMQFVAANNVSGFDRSLDVFTLPFLISSFDGAVRVFKSDIGTNLAESFRKKTGIRVLGFLAAAFRNMMNSKHPINRPADLADLRMRIAKNPIMVATYKALGGSTIGIKPTELYSALSTGTVDGHDGGTAWAWSNKLHEVQKYVSITRHQMVAAVLIINDKRYKALPPRIQKAIRQAADATLAWGNGYTAGLEKLALDDFAKKGLKISHPDLAPFRKAVKPVYAKFAKKVGGMALINRILAMQK